MSRKGQTVFPVAFSLKGSVAALTCTSKAMDYSGDDSRYFGKDTSILVIHSILDMVMSNACSCSAKKKNAAQQNYEFWTIIGRLTIFTSHLCLVQSSTFIPSLATRHSCSSNPLRNQMGGVM